MRSLLEHPSRYLVRLVGAERRIIDSIPILR